jgi:hypothetical protein
LGSSYQAAISAYRGAIDRGFENAQLWCNLGACFLGDSAGVAAEHAFTQAIEMDAQSGVAHFGRARAGLHRATAENLLVSAQNLDDIERALVLLPGVAEVQGIAAVLYANAEPQPAHTSRALSLLRDAVGNGFNPQGCKFHSLADEPEFRALCDVGAANSTPKFRWFFDPLESD